MENNSIVAEKSFAFSIRIVRLFQYLQRDHKEFVLSKQILKSGTSIGANIEEALGGYSSKDFAAKMGIAYKEARETKYWLRLLFATEYISEKEFNSLHNDADQIARILYKIIKKSRLGD